MHCIRIAIRAILTYVGTHGNDPSGQRYSVSILYPHNPVHVGDFRKAAERGAEWLEVTKIEKVSL